VTKNGALSASGLNDQELALIRAALAEDGGVTRAWLFGSRARGSAAPASDIDIAVEGLESGLRVEALRERLNELPIPYAVDVRAVEGIKNAALRGHIARCGVLVYMILEKPTQELVARYVKI
jgi:predicted nucleotidyltransferase